MRPIIMVMLVVDIGIVLATLFGSALRQPASDRLRPIWSSFAIPLLIGGSTSLNIAGDHHGQPGADLLAFAGPLMIGMAIMCVAMLLRQRRDATAAPGA